MLELLKAIQLEKIAIEEEISAEDPHTEFYRKFLSENHCNTIKGALKSNRCDLFTAMLLRGKPEFDIEEVNRVMHGVRFIPEACGYSSLQSLYSIFSKLAENNIYEDVVEIIFSDEEVDLSHFSNAARESAQLIKKLAKTSRSTPLDFAKFMVLFRTIADDQTTDVMVVFAALSDLEIEKEMLEDVLSTKNCNRNADRSKSKYIEESMRKEWNYDRILAPIKETIAYGQKIIKENDSKKKALQKEKQRYDKLEETIYNALQGAEITNAEAIIARVPSDQIRLDALKLMYQHNAEIYKNMQQEYEELAANDARHYQVLLAKYGISPEAYAVGTVMINGIEDLAKMLELLTKLKITEPKELLKIAQTSNLSTVEGVVSLAERGVLSTELIKTQPALFNNETAEYESLKSNLALLQQKRINPHYFDTNQQVLLTPSSVLTESIKNLEDYELLTEIRVGMDLRFLALRDLSPAIDTLLELGYEKNLEENIELLNYKDKFDRLRVLKSLNIPVTTTDQLLEVLTTKKFIVPTELIPEYIYDATVHHLPKNITHLEEPKKKVGDATKLDEYSNTKRTYSFDGVLISKNKVHRNLSNIASTGKVNDRLLYGVIKGSVLTDEEYEKIEAKILPKKASGTVKQKI